MLATRTCSKCGLEKPVCTDFIFSKNLNETKICLECRKEIQRKYKYREGNSVAGTYHCWKKLSRDK